MLRIGIIGTENSHATAFAKAFNLPDEKGNYPYGEVRVTVVMGEDAAANNAVAQAAGVEVIAESLEEFCAHADAAMITCRKGSLHARYALPIIEKGMPLFIDKPLASSVEEAEKIVAAAKEKNVPLCGGSACVYSRDVLALAEEAQKMRAAGTLVSAGMNFAADIHSEYDGFYFYAPHLTEMALTVFGGMPRALTARENKGSVTAVLDYGDYSAALHYTKGTKDSAGTLYGTQGIYQRNISLDGIFLEEASRYVQMLRTGEMHTSYEQLVLPIKLMDAILRAVETGQEIVL